MQDDFEISNEDFFIPILEDNRESENGRGLTVFDYTFNFENLPVNFRESMIEKKKTVKDESTGPKES